MNMHQSIDATVVVAEDRDKAAREADPRAADRLLLDLVLGLGADENYRRAGAIARHFLHYAVVITAAFIVVAILKG